MIDDARGLFTADMAANLLAAFLLVLALLPYAEPPAADPSPAAAVTVLSERAFVDALHGRASAGADSGRYFDIRDTRDLAAACREPSERAPTVLPVLDPAILPVIARSNCPQVRAAKVLIVPAPLKGLDGDWSPAMRRLFAAPLAPEEFRRALLSLLRGGDGDTVTETSRSATMLETLRRLWTEIRPWTDFAVGALLLVVLFRIRNSRTEGAS